MSDDLEDKFKKLTADLKTERDVLRLRAHLLKAEAREELDELEDKWQHFESKMGRVGASAKKSAQEIDAATKQLGEELASAYRRLKDSLD